MRSSSVWLSMKDLPACNRDFMSMQNIESEGFGDCLSLWVWCFRGGTKCGLWSHIALVWFLSLSFSSLEFCCKISQEYNFIDMILVSNDWGH